MSLQMLSRIQSNRERFRKLKPQVSTENTQISFTRVSLYPKQAAIIDDAARFTITEATTKAGKTMSHIEWQLEEMAKLRRGNHWWVAPVNSQADIAFRRAQDRLRGYIDSSGELVKVAEPIPFEQNETKKFIKVFGCTWWFKSADKPDSLYGEDVYTLVSDEITRWKELAWSACYSTLTATKGKAKLIGNVKGKRNFAYKLARKAQSGAQDWSYHKLTANDAIDGGVIEVDTVAQAKRDLPANVYRELYEAEAADDGSNPFGIEAIRQCTMSERSSKPAIAYGIDLAKSVDWTWVYGLDVDGNECFSERWQADWGTTRKRIKQIVGNKPALVDSTGVGDAIVEELQRDMPLVEGYKFSSLSKQQLMEGLASSIQQKTIGFYDPALIDELECFEFEYTRTGVKYSAPEGLHDDGVVAAALSKRKYDLSRRPSFFIGGARE
jgi:hypothetical protein